MLKEAICTAALHLGIPLFFLVNPLLSNHLFLSSCFHLEHHEFERIKYIKGFNAEEDISLTF